VGQAGIGTINQVQVSNHSPVPQYAIIAQPQMLFLILDKHLNRPSFQIVSYNGFHRSTQIVGDNCDMFTFSLTARENDLDCTQLIQFTNSLSQPVFLGFTQAGNVAPCAAVSQNIPAVFGKFAFNRTNRKPSIRLAYAYIMPFPLFAGIDNIWAKIKSVKQNGNLECFRQSSFPDCLASQFGKLTKGNLQVGGMFLFDIQQRSPWDGDTTVIQTHLQNGMAGSVLSGGMMMQFTNGLHLFRSLESLGIINNEEQIAVLLIEKTRQYIQCDLLHNGRLIPVAPPEKFTVIGAMSTVPQQLDEFINSTAMADTYSQYHRPEIAIYMFGNLLFGRPEKNVHFLGNLADGNHTASLLISACYKDTYRHRRLLLFDNQYHQNSFNRSV
jgi:hypothetical protein